MSTSSPSASFPGVYLIEAPKPCKSTPAGLFQTNWDIWPPSMYNLTQQYARARGDKSICRVAPRVQGDVVASIPIVSRLADPIAPSNSRIILGPDFVFSALHETRTGSVLNMSDDSPTRFGMVQVPRRSIPPSPRPPQRSSAMLKEERAERTVYLVDRHEP